MSGKSLLSIIEGINPEFNEDEFIKTVIDTMRATGRSAYRVEQAAEDDRQGIVLLTEQEARLVQYVTNPDNWIISTQGQFCGGFEIDVNTPIEIDRLTRVLRNYFRTGEL